MKCEKSYSEEHSFIPNKNRSEYEENICVHCGYIQNVSEEIFIKKRAKQ